MKVASSWDVVIAGASFAGLAAATQLAGRGSVLLIDRQPVGEGETSACATPLPVLERLGALDAVEQIHTELVIHSGDVRAISVMPAYPFATFDYRKLCQILRSRTDATVLLQAVRAREGDTVITQQGFVRARVLIDASGCEGVFSLKSKGRAASRSLGIEARAPVAGEGLHIWLRPKELSCGMAWIFPAGGHSRIGVACYRGHGDLRRRLNAFSPLTVGQPLHGGRLPSRLAAGTDGAVFRVGDAAGLCLPVTGEGIRRRWSSDRSPVGSCGRCSPVTSSWNKRSRPIEDRSLAELRTTAFCAWFRPRSCEPHLRYRRSSLRR